MRRRPGAGTLPLPFQFLAAWVGVWVARHQTDEIDYLRTEPRADGAAGKEAVAVH